VIDIDAQPGHVSSVQSVKCKKKGDNDEAILTGISSRKKREGARTGSLTSSPNRPFWIPRATKSETHRITR
jgi:hypothetical protein